jgi:hypothetical protein
VYTFRDVLESLYEFHWNPQNSTIVTFLSLYPVQSIYPSTKISPHDQIYMKR